EDARIARIAPASALRPDREITVIDATGRFLLPGLTDAHVHFSATEADGRATRPLAAFALRVAAFIEETLDQRSTTVRDAGGLDPEPGDGLRRRRLADGPDRRHAVHRRGTSCCRGRGPRARHLRARPRLPPEEHRELP